MKLNEPLQSIPHTSPRSKGEELAHRIHRHLKRWEADKRFNKPHPEHNTSPLWLSNCGRSGNRIRICYVSYQGSQALTFADAEAYLAFLDKIALTGGKFKYHFNFKPDKKS